MFETKVEVRYGETDKMGVVYHARYFPWFEIAREKFIESYGMRYADLEHRGVMMPLVDCYCKFIKGAMYGDTVTIGIEPKKIGVAKCEFSYTVTRESDGELLAVGSTKHGFVDFDFKPVNIKKRYPDIYSVFEKMRGERL